MILKIIDKLYAKKVSSKGLAIFRICFSINLLLEIFRIFRYRALYFDPLPFIQESPIDYTFPLFAWMIILILLTLGAFTRVMTIINYLFSVIFISTMGAFEYHMDYAYIGMSFLMMFIPLSQSFSIDRLIKKYKHSNTTFTFKPIEKTSQFYYFLLLTVGIGFVYLGSIFYKFNSDIWMNGLGMWLPASLPQATIFNDSWLMNQEYLIKFLGYFTIAFELIFPFIFFIKRLRVPLLIIGVGLHLGILIEFPIPYFALGAIAIYMLLAPLKWWDKLQDVFRSKTPSLTFYYDAECPLCIRTKITIKHFDAFNKVEFKSVQQSAGSVKALADISEDELLDNVYSIDKKGKLRNGIKTYRKVFLLLPAFFLLGVLLYIPGISHLANRIYKYIANNRTVERCTEDNCGFTIAPVPTETDDIKILQNLKVKDVIISGWKILVILLVVLQINAIAKVPINNIIAKNRVSGSNQSVALSKLISAQRSINHLATKFLGITPHPVFVDEHFRGFDKIYNVAFNGTLLPMCDASGMPGKYLSGGSWVNFAFRVNSPRIHKFPKMLKEGLVHYAAFWAHENNVDLNDAEFKIIRKEIKVQFKWEKNLLKNNLETPWEEVGTMVWKNKSATVNLEVEK